MMARCLVLLMVFGLLAAGCATSGREARTNTAIEDFIVVAQLEEADKIRTRGDYGYSYLSDRFVILNTRDAEVLVRFQRRCREWHELRVQPDIRYDSNYLRPRVDTIRGCRIDKMYALEPGQVAELEYIGDSPGER